MKKKVPYRVSKSSSNLAASFCHAEIMAKTDNWKEETP
jgi:hypothetical protein